MAPTIPTYRPLFTATRVAAFVSIMSLSSSIYLVLADAHALEAQRTAASTTLQGCGEPVLIAQHQ